MTSDKHNKISFLEIKIGPFLIMLTEIHTKTYNYKQFIHPSYTPRLKQVMAILEHLIYNV